MAFFLFNLPHNEYLYRYSEYSDTSNLNKEGVFKNRTRNFYAHKKNRPELHYNGGGP